MAVDLYLPYKLQSEIDRFKELRGNINLDYRSDNVSTPYVLDTSYVKVTDTNLTIDAGVAPFTISEDHISGDNTNFRTFTTDFLVVNRDPFQSNVVILNSLDNIINAMYFKTTAVKVGSRNTLVHVYQLNTEITNTSIVLTPVYYDGTRDKLGVVDKKICDRLVTTPIPGLSSLTVEPRQITLIQDTDVDRGHNVEIPRNLVAEYITGLTLFKYVNPANKSTTKLRLVSNIGTGFTNVNSSPLSVLSPNYNLYYKETSNNVNAEGYCVNLKAGEGVLINASIQTTLEDYTSVVSLGLDRLMVSATYTGGLATYFNSLKIQLPTEVPKNSLEEDVPLRLLIDNTIYKLPSFINTQFSEFCTSLRAILKPLNIELIERGDNTFFLYGTRDKDTEITFAYLDYYITTVEDISTVPSIYSQPNLDYTEEGYPPNLSLSYDVYKDSTLFEEEGEGYSNFYLYTTKVSQNPSKTLIAGFFNYAEYLVDKASLKAAAKVFKAKVGETDITVNLNSTTSELTTILADLKTALQPSFTTFTLEVDEDKETIKFKSNITAPQVLKINSDVLSLSSDYKGLYEKVEGIDTFLIGGSD